MVILSAASTTALLASVSTAIGDTSLGLYAIFALAIALPLMFWFFHAVKKMFTYTGKKVDGLMFKGPIEDISTVEYAEHRMRRADYSDDSEMQAVVDVNASRGLNPQTYTEAKDNVYGDVGRKTPTW